MTLQARYTIRRKIADGGTAEIFLATQRGAHGFEKPVVLKRIFPAFYADPQFRNMLIDEAHIAMSLNHSNIVQVLDLGEADGQYFLALELVDGWTLDAVLRRARALKTAVPPALALYMTAEVCRALAYAHAKVGPDDKPLGIVHRDISPHNLLLSEQGEVKLTDFGIAQAKNRRESSLGNIIKGKIAYMSPEQASGGSLDARSDLFSVGTMLYVMVCHRYPFDAATDLEVLLLVKSGEFEAPENLMPGLNPEIYRVIKRAMAKDPAERYQRSEEMLIDVEHVMRVAFRAVGQTELKRWLQDLSMRDGVLPLTRQPVQAVSADDRSEGETLELKGVGTTPGATLPPPTLGSRSHQPPLPPAARLAAGGKSRPPPPPAAMAVGKKPAIPGTATGGIPAPRPPGSKSGSLTVPKSAAGAPTSPLRAAAPASPNRDGAPESDDAAVSDEQINEITPTPTPLARPPAASQRPSQGALPVVHTSGAADKAAVPDAPSSGGASTRIEAPLGAAAGRKSSSWVAEAVAASAQRAGTTPAPPPVVSNVPPPPVALAVPPAGGSVAVPAELVDTAPVQRSTYRRASIIAAGLLALGVAVVGLSTRSCGPAQQAEPTVRQESKSAAAPIVVPPVVASRVPPPSAAVAAVVPTDAMREVSDAEPASGAVMERSTVSDATVDASSGDASASSAAVLAAGTNTESTTEAVVSSAVTAPDGSGDPDAGTAAASTPKVLVVLSSTPPGAQVGTAKRSFGTTPVSVKMKVGRNYALTFTLQGYQSVTKQFRVADFADQQVTAVLRRDSAPPKPQPAPTVTQPAPAAKPDKNWFQRMFAR